MKGKQTKDNGAQDDLKSEWFETIFNMTLDIDGRITGRHKLWTAQPSTKNMLNFTINHRWDGAKAKKSSDVNLSMEAGANETVVVKITAPFFENPRPPGGAPGLPYLNLWDYEAVELFFLNDREQYLEVQVEFDFHAMGIVRRKNRKTFEIRWDRTGTTSLSCSMDGGT